MASKIACPDCGEKIEAGTTFVLGHRYCPECDIRFNDIGNIVGEGRV